MSEERLSRIENILAAIQAQMATKQELQALRAEMATKKELQALRAEVTTLGADMATLRAQVATKADLEAALSGVATNVEITLLGRQLRELMSMKDDITVVSAMAQRLDNTMVRLINDVLTEVRAEHSRMDRLLSRVRALEEAQPHGG
jgi:cob(I)alamin adenosyltransferase